MESRQESRHCAVELGVIRSKELEKQLEKEMEKEGSEKDKAVFEGRSKQVS